MDKAKFVEYVDKIKDYINKEEAIDEALRALSPDFGGFTMGDALSDIIDLLSRLIEDDGHWLDYYVWETECGTNNCADSVTANGVKIPFKTPEDVYNLIIEERIDSKDDSITNYLIEERDKYKKLYENEKDHSETLQKIIDKITNTVVDGTISEAAKEAVKKTTVSGNTLTLDELLETITDELLREFGKDE